MNILLFLVLAFIAVSQKPQPTASQPTVSQPTASQLSPADEVPCPGGVVDRGQFPNLGTAPVLTTRQQWGSRTWACSTKTCKVGTGCSCLPKSSCYCLSRCSGKTPACGPCSSFSNIWEFENITTITIHHTAVPRQSFSYSQSVANMISIQDQHMDVNGWCDIGYHFILDSVGNVFQGRPFWDDAELSRRVTGQVATSWNSGPGIIQGAHSGDRCSNHNNIGVALLGCYDSNTAECPNGVDPIDVGDATYNNLLNVLSYLCKQYGVNPNNIKLHRDFVSTTCPGDKIVSLLPGIKTEVAFRIQ